MRALEGVWLCSLVMLSFPAAATADVVGPKPLVCAPWKVAVSDHEGSRCEARAPDDCPSGWVGQVGGECVLARCDGGSRCPSGTVCADQSACVRNIELEIRGVRSGVFRDIPVGICGPSVTCDAPDRCAAWKVCVEPGTTAVAHVPARGVPDKGPPRKKTGGCSLSAGEEGTAREAWIGAVGLILGLGWRRRRLEARAGSMRRGAPS